MAGDPDILTDYVIPANGNPMNITGDFFTFTGFRKVFNTSSAPEPNSFTVTKATMAEFPALNGQSVSYATLVFPPSTVNPPHTHPRSGELLLLVDGALSVGFIDTTNKLYTQDLAAGDMFVFPKGMVHFQFNSGNQPAMALSAFGSAAPGVVPVPVTVFGTGIDDAVLAKSFKTDVPTILKLKANLTPPNNRSSVSLGVLLLLAVILSAGAADPDILTDFVVPSDTDPSGIDGAFFTYKNLVTGNSGDPAKLTVTKATHAEFPALLGQSVSYAALVFGAGTVNPPHIHPRASELLVVVQGPLLVGLVDAARNGTVYTQTLQTGDMFVFPKGMVHFQFNNGTDVVARAFSAFGSATPGTISLPAALFGSGIDDTILDKSMHTDQATVDQLKQDQAPPSPGSSSSAAAALLPSRWAITLLLCFAASYYFYF
uniref:Cupin type-1 domain-containing protein n=1 Tax=Oryza nivara TaxID=4536 RepID=A0A0E0GFN6_ORYNI